MERNDPSSHRPEYGRQIETEPVDVHRLDPVAQRVHYETDDVWTVEVEAVATAGEVHVVALRRVRRSGQAVVARVVEAAKHEARAEFVAFTCVVVHDVEQHLDAGAMQRPDERLEFCHLAAGLPDSAVRALGREKSNRVVAPVVGQATSQQEVVDVELVNREQFHRVDAEPLQVWNLLDEPEVGAGQRHAGGPVRREALDVDLVDEQLLQSKVRRDVALPVEGVVVDHNRLRRGR